MSIISISEGDLDFTFIEWDNVLKFDVHVDYVKVKNALEKTNGVDFLGLRSGGLYLIEVKDFRGYVQEQKERLKDSELMIEVGQKVKGALACILAGSRNSTNESELWKNSIDVIRDIKKTVCIILWMEEDVIVSQESQYKVRLDVLTKTLKQRLNWISSRVIILNKRLQNSLGINVSYKNVL